METGKIKRVLMINSIRGFVGGVERMLVSLARDFSEQGIDVYGLFEQESSREEAFETAFHSIRCAGKDEIDDLITFYHEENIDLVFIHKCSFANWVVGFNKEFKTVVLVHDHDYYCLRRHKYFPYKRINCPLPFNLAYCSMCSMLIKRQNGKLKPFNPIPHLKLLQALRACSLVFVLSDFMKNNLIMNGFEKNKIKILVPYQKCASIAEPNSPANPVVLFAGQLIRGKGVDLLLVAMQKLKNPARLRIVGRGNDSNYLQQLCQNLGLWERTEFVNWTDDMESEYQRADLVVVPSRWQEPFGLIGIEAFAHAKAVVAFDVGGIREWLKHKHNGLLVPAGNIDKLADSIDILLSSKELRCKNGKAAYDTVANQYNYQRHMKTLFTPLEEL